MIQSIYLLVLVTTILLFFLCFNVHANKEKNNISVPATLGASLTRPALIQKIDQMMISGQGHVDRLANEIVEANPAANNPYTVTTGAAGEVLLSFGVRR